MSQSSVPKANSLAEAVRRFETKKKPSQVLEQHHESVIDLRARGATYTQIFELLRAHGIATSEQTIIRFYQRHTAELKRRTAELKLDASPSISSDLASVSTPLRSTTSAPAPSSAAHGLFRDLRGLI